ncbi:unnamed protein product [Hermetia illucens]|uniref:Asparagine synthetase [glutamine-hydrolyzing] n=1 Tax=Hermetia illucens TaxID=343691 RepID=A0A7R8UKJ3_HERIL|nr:probable asparagine synthetase [glutamine-hydrolyzing] [Hermetia illucens]CAD7082390.1 unnamed protein product [Hermetia illucens]
MCGILAVFSATQKPFHGKHFGRKLRQSFREMAYTQSGKQRHRGPDYTGVEVVADRGVVMVHERLSIVGVDTGNQPFKSDDDRIVLAANGEIYNFREISKIIREERGVYKPKSDCSVLIELYEDYGENLFEHITGMYAFALYDKLENCVLIARDPHGIIPLYFGRDDEQNFWVASEMKCLVDVCGEIEILEPGTMMVGQVNKLEKKRFFNPLWYEKPLGVPTDLTRLRKSLESAVRSHLECEVDFAALLSGGVDSSLIASIATKIIRKTDPAFKLKTFSVGLPGAPDFAFSRKVADYIGSDHTELHFTVEEGLDCIKDVIYKLETYDVNTIRCSIPMYLLTRYIKSKGIKMILVGEGSDEVFGGYLYFYKAPSPESFHEELVNRVRKLHLSDCLRTNKTAMAWGIELRVPYLDKDFVNLVMSIDPTEKIPGPMNSFYCNGLTKEATNHSPQIEKYILRKAFDDGTYLPDEVLWRQKEQFSDGVGYAWIDTIREYATSHITDEEFSKATETFPINTPLTKEAFYYRTIFEDLFPGDHCARTVKKWQPREDWGCCSHDPSGRKQTVHKAHK